MEADPNCNWCKHLKLKEQGFGFRCEKHPLWNIEYPESVLCHSYEWDGIKRKIRKGQ